ncbi:hypothetical protein IWZ03DRAFT_356992 [Phyllosticta citriasiana]|uniref:Uncharacterized protein n=1 Tax=Phyllosticta citriasiana TaxID=595635 RepID=A0ABR1L3H1_9PEZI
MSVMEFSRPCSSVYSRDEDGNPFNSPAQPQIDTRGNFANDMIQSAMSAANRLLWADDFQTDIIEAIKILDQMQGLLQVALNGDIDPELEVLGKKVTGILTAWTRRNQRISVDARLWKVAGVSDASQRDPKTRIEPLPTVIGCQVNVETAQGLQTFFVNCVTCLRDTRYYTSTDIRVNECLVAIRDRLVDVVFSAEQASKDTDTARKTLSETSFTEASRNNEQSKNNMKGKHQKVKLTFEGLFSTRSGKKHDASTGNSEAQGMVKQSVQISEDNAPPILSALPRVALGELEAQQHEGNQTFAAINHQNEQVCSGEVPNVTFGNQNHPETFEIPKVDYGDEAQELKPFHESRNVYQTSTDAKIARETRQDSMMAGPSENHQSIDLGRPGVLSQLERELRREFVRRIKAERPKSVELSRSRSWWRERALAALEGQEQEHKDEWEDCEEEDWTEEDLAAKRVRDAAKALEILEGVSSSEAGSERLVGGVEEDQDSLRFSFQPDEMEWLGRDL